MAKRRIIFGIAAAPALVLLALALALNLRREWVTARPEVDLTPRRPDLAAADVPVGSGFDLLLRAISTPSRSAMALLNDYDPGEKISVQGWPEGWRETEPAPPASVGVGDSEPVPVLGDGSGDADIPIEELIPPEPESPADPEPPLFDPDTPWTAEETAALKWFLQEMEPALALARRAAEDPDPQVPTALGPSDLLEYLRPVKTFVLVFALSARAKAEAGDLDGAADDLVAGIRFGNIVSRGGCLINRLVDTACTAIACRALWEITLDHGPPSSLKARAVLTELKAIEDGAEPLAETFRYEAKVACGAVDELVAMSSSGGTSGYGVGVPRGAVPVMTLLGSSPRRMKRDLNACFTHLVHAADQRDPAIAEALEMSLRRPANPVTVLTMEDPLGYILASMLLPALGQAIDKDLRREATLRLTRVFLAASAYRAQSGHPPWPAAVLVPEFLPEVPRDPYDGAPVRYRLERDGSWLVYSIGPDALDDGGDADAWCGYRRRQTSGSYSRRDQPDLVVPGQPFPESVVEPEP